MKYFYSFLIVIFSISNSFSSFDTYETLYKARFILKNGNEVTGYYYHFNYESVPKYTFTNEEFLDFLKKTSKDKNDTLEIYSDLQNINIKGLDLGGYKVSAVIKKDLYKVDVKEIKGTEFISGCSCDKSDKNCIVIKEFTLDEINKIKSGNVAALYEIGDSNEDLYPEAGYRHIAIGEPKSISEEAFKSRILELYTKKEDYYSLDLKKYFLLKEELRKAGVILLTFYVTDYYFSNIEM